MHRRSRKSVRASRAHAGVSIVEALLAMAVFAVLAAGTLVFIWQPLTSAGTSDERSRAAFLAQEGIEAARSIRNDGWLDLADGVHGIDSSSGTWQFSGTEDTDGSFTRVVEVAPVERDPSGNVVASGGSIDPRTKRITSTVTWDSLYGGSKILSYDAYLTHWNAYDWRQTTDADFNVGTFGGTTVKGTGEGASIELETAFTKTWNLSAGSVISHTSDTDFSPGTFSGTVVFGTGDTADVRETGSPSWVVVRQGKSFFHTSDTDFSSGSFSGTVVAGVGDQGSVILGKVLKWFAVPSPTPPRNSNDVSAVSGTDAWAAGKVDEIIRWDGTAWSVFTTPSNTELESVQMLSATDGWMTGKNGAILRWNGTAWTAVASPVNNKTLFDVHMISASDGFIVGAGGTILRWNGTAWTALASPTTQDLYGVSMLDATEGYAVGAGGTILRWNGTAWTAETSATTAQLNDVAVVSSSRAYAVGSGGTIVRRAPSGWSALVSPTVNNLNGLDMLSASNGYAVGAAGTILRWDGSSWTVQPSGTTDVLNDIDMRSADDGFIVGDGSYLRYGLAYADSGTFLSPTLDAGAVADWGHLVWNEDLPLNTDLTVATRTGPTSNPNNNWSAWSAETTEPGGAMITSPNNRYLQYRLTLTTSDAQVTAELLNINITYDEPAADTYFDMTTIGTSDGWMVGSNGGISRYDGVNWADSSSPVTTSLFGVDDLGAGAVWAVGSGGAVIRWNGLSWNQEVAPTTEQLNGVSAVTPSAVWAVGTRSAAIRWDGTSWTSVAIPGNRDLNAVDMLSASDGFIVGDNGTILRWNGTAWSTVTSPTNRSLYDIDCLSATECWAVGSQGAIVRWDGSAWSSVVSPVTVALETVGIISGQDVWASGVAATFIHYTPTFPASATYTGPVMDSGVVNTVWNTLFWSPVLPVSTELTLATRTGATSVPDGTWSAWSTEYTANGGAGVVSPPGRYLQYRATFTTADAINTARLQDVTLLYGQATGQDIHGIDGVDASNVWAVGDYGAVVKFDGTAWLPQTSPVATLLREVDMVSSTDGMAVGWGGKIIRWNGTTWTSLTSPTVEELRDVSLASSSDGFAVGYAGTILHWDGTDWTSVTSPVVTDLHGVAMLSATDGYAVGKGGVILHWDGTDWTSATSPVVTDLNAVHMYSASLGFAVGTGGTIVKWDGTSWAMQSSPALNDLYDVEVRSNIEAWAVGRNGTIIRWNGASWLTYASPTTIDLNSLTLHTSDDGWIGGNVGIMFRDPAPYQLNGTFISSVLDTDVLTPTFDTLFFVAALPAGTSVTVAVRSGTTPVPDGSWSAWTTESSSTEGIAITSPSARYIQYRASLATADEMFSPEVESVTVTYRD